MTEFGKKISVEGFQLTSIDTHDIDKISKWFPKTGIDDINMASLGMILSLHGMNACQEIIMKIDILAGYKESEKNKAWMNAIDASSKTGNKTIKDKEWLAQADAGYIEVCNELMLARAAKKYFENKADYFKSWHYAFKSFIARESDVEKLANIAGKGYGIAKDFFSEDHGREDTEKVEWCE